MLNKKKSRGNDSSKHPRGTHATSHKSTENPRNLPTENTSMAANTNYKSSSGIGDKREERKQERDRS